AWSAASPASGASIGTGRGTRRERDCLARPGRRRGAAGRGARRGHARGRLRKPCSRPHRGSVHHGRGAQAARAAAVWARIREAPRSGGRGGDGLLICIRLACAPPGARPHPLLPSFGSSACTFLAATFQGLTLPLPRHAAPAGAPARGNHKTFERKGPRGGKRRRIPRSEGAATCLPRCPAARGKLGPDSEKPLHPPPPHPPPRPSSSSSSAARGPEALHTGALRWTCTRPGASPLRPPAPREVPRPRPGKSPTRSPAEAQKAFLDPGCVRGGTWTFSPSTSIYLFSSYYALVGPEEVRTSGSGLDGSTSRRPGRARTHSICAPSPSVYTTVPFIFFWVTKQLLLE
ncbi:hypothetical protein EI555_021474, partial [Monodon monoceros]